MSGGPGAAGRMGATTPTGGGPMTVEDLAKRVAALEAEVQELRAKVGNGEPPKRSVLDLYGKYADDPTFEEATRIGREYRERVNRESLEEFDREEAAAQAKAKASKPVPRRRKSDAGA